MIRFLGKLWKDRRGNVLIIAGAALPVLVGMAGLATDTIEWTLWKRQLQRAADSAAIAGVYDREANNGSHSNTSTAVCNDLAINLHTSMSLNNSTNCTGSVGGYTSLSYPADSGAETNQVQVTLAVQQKLPFSSLFLLTTPTISATATAASVTTGTPCALALNKSGTAMDYSGNATVSAATCILYSDSTSSNSASAGGSSAVTAKSVAAVGGIQQSNNFKVQSYIPYSPSISDPYANIKPDPNDMKCAQQALTAGMDITTIKDSNGNQANCFTSLSVGSNKTLAIPDSYTGPIYLNGGSVDLKGAFSCSHCTIVLTNKDQSSTATIGTFSSNAQASNNITAPTTGTYAGMAVFQDSRATGNTDQINGGAGNIINGAVYFPSDTLKINGSGLVDSSGHNVSLCAMWVAKNITFLGNSSIGMSSPDDAVCSGYGMPNPGAKMVRLVA